MILKNGQICDAIHRDPYTADIAVRGGKIAAIGENLSPDAGEEVLDARGSRVYPGFVEAHCHVGLHDYGMGREGHDFNEHNDLLTPHLRAIDGFYPQDRAIEKALRAGVTTICTGPGSANVVGGTFYVFKTYGNCADDMLLRPAVAMKCAFGENPKAIYADRGNSTRMTTAAKLREILFATQEYLAKKEAAGEDASKLPKFDMKLEAMIPVLRGEIPLKAHAHRADDICTAIRIAREFRVRLTIEHTTEGHLIVDELVRAGFPVAVGPSYTNASKIELAEKSAETAGILARAGLDVSIITDAPVIPEEYLPLCAGLAVRAGMDPFDALRAITIRAARHAGVADRVGSIEVGKDADLLLCDDDPLHNQAAVKAVFLDGKRVV